LSAAKIDREWTGVLMLARYIDGWLQPGYESDALIARIHDSTAVKSLHGAPKF